ncbi:MAG: hypothetical protein Q7U37_04355 [Gallionella sp.]|nr:hypothetical protein [Gallionella sp.]
MLTLPLEPTDDRADPIFKDAAGCAQWLGQLQLTNLHLAHGQLLTQINEFNRYPMRGLERLNTLELLRETVSHVQEDFARKLIGKPLPLNESELMVFQAIVQLWQSLVTGYQRGLQAYIAGEKPLSKYGALLCQRCLLYSGLEIIEYLRTGYDFDAGLWHQLHELYAYAEQQEIHQLKVTDPLSTIQSSCICSYVKTLLACYASPAQLTRWQLQQLDYWLSLWGNAVTVERRYSLIKGDAHPLATDLSSTQGLQRAEGLPHSDSLRFLAMVPLSKLLRVKIILLQQGQTPRQVGLGDHADSQSCLELLNFLHQSWCENSHKRVGERQPIARHAQLCYKPEGIYVHLSGKPIQQNASDIDSLGRKLIATPARTPDHAEKQLKMGHPLESWHMENESIMGARLIRADAIGGRLMCKQLIALRPSDALSFILGVTAWTNVTRQGRLEIGIKYLPGRPEPLRIRASGINPASKHAPAFLLPALPSLNIPASLIIPRDWFRDNRVIELLHPDGQSSRVKLGFSVERGLDYERVSFTPD